MGRLHGDPARRADDERDQEDRLDHGSLTHLEKGANFDILKSREGNYRAWDHQLMQEMYTITFKNAADVKDRWDLFTLSAPVPAASQSLEVIAPTRDENNCTMPA